MALSINERVRGEESGSRLNTAAAHPRAVAVRARTNTCAAVVCSGGREKRGGGRREEIGVAPGDVYANLREHTERKTKPPLLTARRGSIYVSPPPRPFSPRGMFAICKHSKQLVGEVSMGRNEMEMVGRIGF